MTKANVAEPVHVLALERTMDAPVENIWRCLTEPELLERWFCPKPWYVTDASMELRPGGKFYCVMNGPNGERIENIGVFLEVEELRRLVTTDALLPGWIPSGRAFMVAETCVHGLDKDRTRYTARAMHWTEASRKEHEEMGFHKGWGTAADQLETLARSF